MGWDGSGGDCEGPGASMDEDPQSRRVPGTDLSSSHSSALRDDGA